MQSVGMQVFPLHGLSVFLGSPVVLPSLARAIVCVAIASAGDKILAAHTSGCSSPRALTTPAQLCSINKPSRMLGVWLFGGGTTVTHTRPRFLPI